MNFDTIESVACSLIKWAWNDSRVVLDEDFLCAAIKDDYDFSGRYPTEKECEHLVRGSVSGTVPDELISSFPEIYDFLDQHWHRRWSKIFDIAARCATHS